MKSFAVKTRTAIPHAQRASVVARSSKRSLELDLISKIFSAVGQRIGNPVQAAETIVEKATKGLQTPPPDFPRGPSGDQGLALVSDPLGFLTSLQAQFGDIVGFVLAGERVVMVADPVIAKEVLVERPDIFIKEGTAFFPGSKLAGEGLLVSDGEVWKRQRQLANPAFRKAAVESYAQAMVSVTHEMLSERWEGGGLRDVYADFNEVTLQIVATALFGSDMKGPRAKLIAESIKTAFDFFGRRASTGFAIPEWLPIPDNIQYNAAVSTLDEVVYDLIRTRRKELMQMEASGRSVAPRDLLDRLMLSRDENNTGMEDRSLRDELMTLMVAGQETSAILLAWCLFELASNPQVQDRCARQIEMHFKGRQPTAADIGSEGLQLVEAVILETMRVLPPAYMVGRCASREVLLSGATYRLPKGTTVLVSPYLMQTDYRHWAQASSFLPDRWLPVLNGQPMPENSIFESRGAPSSFNTSARPYSYQSASSSSQGAPAAPTGAGSAMAALRNMGPNGAYIPFGAGPRNCIGTGFAMMEVTLVLGWILSRYRIELPTGVGVVPIRPQPLITLRPSPVELNLVPRTKH